MTDKPIENGKLMERKKLTRFWYLFFSRYPKLVYIYYNNMWQMYNFQNRKTCII